MSTMWADFEPFRVDTVSSSSMFCRASPVQGWQSQAITGTASTTTTNLPKPTFSKCKRYSTAAATWAPFSGRQSSFTFSSERERERESKVHLCLCAVVISCLAVAAALLSAYLHLKRLATRQWRTAAKAAAVGSASVATPNGQ